MKYYLNYLKKKLVRNEFFTDIENSDEYKKNTSRVVVKIFSKFK